MFAVVRTGGKQYRVALGDKIVVERLDGDAGSRIDITDVLLAGEGSDLKSVKGLTVAAEIIAQAKADKVTVFKKRRRHNYRRKKGHRQQHTILRIVAIGDQKYVPSKAAGAESKPKTATAPAKPKDAPASKPQVEQQPTANPAPDDDAAAKGTPNPTPQDDATAKAAKPAKTVAKKPPAAKVKPEAGSTKDAAPAKSAAKKAASKPAKPTKKK